MIAQLVTRRAEELAAGSSTTPPSPAQADLKRPQALNEILTADPLDLMLHMEQVWGLADVWTPAARPTGDARRALIGLGAYRDLVPSEQPAWHHFGYSLCIKNTRACQIMTRAVHAFRSGEGLGIASVETQRWVDATEALLFGAVSLLGTAMATSAVRPNAESVRRNAYWRMFGMDLAFGADGATAHSYDRAAAANTTFVALFEELLGEVSSAFGHRRSPARITSKADDRILQLADQVGSLLRARRQNGVLAREELAAATAMGWLEATLSSNTPVIVDLRAQAANPADRLRLVGERVGLAPHAHSGAFLAMAPDLSVLLRVLESGRLKDHRDASLLYSTASPAIGAVTRRVITEWAVATGHDLRQHPPVVSQ